ncbi:hypothetical protein AB0G04_43710, partial [Actinoplanes sp. NPDC023801]|uniref:hypothetical protein n=1 Tax=Actinoplanes sp. NPDC023801 TaxID=3154595 RepID=UPI0033DAEA9D
FFATAEVSTVSVMTVIRCVSLIRSYTVVLTVPRAGADLAAGWNWPWLAAAREALRRDMLDAQADSGEPQESRDIQGYPQVS